MVKRVLRFLGLWGAAETALALPERVRLLWGGATVLAGSVVTWLARGEVPWFWLLLVAITSLGISAWCFLQMVNLLSWWQLRGQPSTDDGSGVAPAPPEGAANGIDDVIRRAKQSVPEYRWKKLLGDATPHGSRPYTRGSDFVFQTDVFRGTELVDLAGSTLVFSVVQEEGRVISKKPIVFGDDVGHLICPITASESSLMIEGQAVLEISGHLPTGQRANIGPFVFDIREPLDAPPPVGARAVFVESEGKEVTEPAWPTRFVAQSLFEATIDPAYIYGGGSDKITSTLVLRANRECVSPMHLSVQVPAGYQFFQGFFVRRGETLVLSWFSSVQAGCYLAEIRSPQFKPGDELQLLVSGPEKLPSVPIVKVGEGEQ